MIATVDIARAAQHVGWTDEALVVAVAVALGESDGDERSHYNNAATGDDSYGLWQINMRGALGPDRRARYGLASNAELFIPAVNARVAFDIYVAAGRSFRPWGAFTDSGFRKYGRFEKAQAAVAALKGGQKMGTAQQALDVARHWVGYEEGAGNHTTFGAWYGLDNNPWCAMFVSYCTYTTGMPLPISTPKGFAYCPTGVNWFKAHKSWHATPKVGDLIFFDWSGGRAGAEHVGIVEKVNADGSVGTIEGNSNNQVERRTRSGSVILGYGRPSYASSASPAKPAPAPSPPAHARWPGRNLTLTSPYTKGDDVGVVQDRLNHHGNKLAVDRVFGPLTAKAVIAFQKSRKLQADGVVGPITWDALWS